MLSGGSNDERSSKIMRIQGFFLEICDSQDLPFEAAAALANEQLAFAWVNELTRAGLGVRSGWGSFGACKGQGRVFNGVAENGSMKVQCSKTEKGFEVSKYLGGADSLTREVGAAGQWPTDSGIAEHFPAARS
ncbi:hypothetical protein MRB53_020460 [Persea americana]|uniref:Uncharacterized protein n=1 Tax=Persea americana TaxID=3435 RepID=A0ACC2L1B5_PERAE|nr:hypothetical protein MRB53_020460 [Persea americana]